MLQAHPHLLMRPIACAPQAQNELLAAQVDELRAKLHESAIKQESKQVCCSMD
jgi:hypothetical protein